MTKPLYTSAAYKDLADILDYIAPDKPMAALQWIEKIEAKCLFISTKPGIGEAQPHLGEGVRSTFVGRYVIFHREVNEQVAILRVIPGDRNITRL